ncbi:hypothetical protein BJF81_00230 [Ornithinimicrobium sp. CNJ-824]|nr:hypothetical protein BJF81_00230 [Ornithinimicrobium sp. CNJ-824]
MAATLMRQRYADAVRVFSAGTRPGSALNAESVAALAEVGASTEGEHPKPVDAQLVDQADLVVLLGEEVELDPSSTPVQRWVTDEPSRRGIEGMERMRLVRDDIAARVASLGEQLGLRSGA